MTTIPTSTSNDELEKILDNYCRIEEPNDIDVLGGVWVSDKQEALLALRQYVNKARVQEVDRMPATSRSEMLGYKRDRVSQLTEEVE